MIKIKKIPVIIIILSFILLSTTTPTLAQNLEVTANTEKNTYTLREIVKIYGNVTYNNQPVTQGFVSIQVENPRSTILYRTIPVGTPPKTSNVKIISAYPCDTTGNPKNQFERGDWAYFKVTVKNDEIVPQEVLITVTAFDSDLIPLGTGATKITIDPGKTVSYIPAIWISKWASTGTCPVYFNVYTDYPKNKGYPYCPEEIANFTIIESKYEEPPSNPLPEQPIQNGSYQTQFRLSPEPLPGNYTVHVCAWYQGWKSIATTEFQVEDIEAPPRASFVALPPIAGPNQTITFDASYSSPEGYNDTIISYQWDLGDGTQTTGKIITYSYPNEGNYTVTLNVTDSEGFWNTTTKLIIVKIIRDIAIVEIECLNEIYNNWLTKIKITVQNKGTTTETFTLTAYYNSSIIGSATITNLASFEQKTVSITWNTTGLVPLTNYTIWAEIPTLPDEFNTTDNQLTYGTVIIKLLGDVVFDRIIDISDVVSITSIYGISEGSPGWDPQADLKPDGTIDISDVVLVTSVYWTSY